MPDINIFCYCYYSVLYSNSSMTLFGHVTNGFVVITPPLTMKQLPWFIRKTVFLPINKSSLGFTKRLEKLNLIEVYLIALQIHHIHTSTNMYTHTHSHTHTLSGLQWNILMVFSPFLLPVAFLRDFSYFLFPLFVSVLY